MAEDPKAAVAPLEANTTLDDRMSFEPERLSYRSADRIASDLVSELADALVPAGRPVVVTGGELFVDLANLASVMASIQQCEQQYRSCAAFAQELLQPELVTKAVTLTGVAELVVPALAPVTTAVQSAVGLLGLFRENVEYRGVTTAVDQLAVRFAVAARLKASGVTAYLHDTVIPALSTGLQTDLQRALDAAETTRARAWSAAAPHLVSLMEAQADLDAAARVPTNEAAVQVAATNLTRLRQRINPLSDALERADTHLSALRSLLEKVDETTGLMMLAKLLRAERTQSLAPYYLDVRVVASGGHHRVSRSLLRTMFVGDGLSAMGGVVVRWGLLDTDGSLLAGGLRDGRATAGFPREGWPAQWPA